MILQFESGKRKLFLEPSELELTRTILEVISEDGNEVQQDIARNLLHRVRRGDGWTIDQARIFDGWSRDIGYEAITLPDLQTTITKAKAELEKLIKQSEAKRNATTNVIHLHKKS